ncbi:serpin B3-like [Dermacentor andersoni]|uniref:serpin B3-like n=1 Tax=Dermacentor andersoni TaxID=34620 RepID=UPI0021558BF5|nr:serpin B3-like [Dermacentor andersoni]
MAQTPATDGAPEIYPPEPASAGSVSGSLEEGDEDERRSPSIGSQELELGATGPLLEPQALEHVVFAINSFAHRLLRYLPRQQNLSFSPSHLYWLLVSVWFGSKGTTREQLEGVLRCAELPVPGDRVQGFFKNLIRTLMARGKQQRVQFISALYVTSVDRLQNASSKALRENFYVSIRALLADARPERTRNEINLWFETMSRGHVPSVMSENLSTTGGDGSSSACHVIASAAYAELAWGSRFDHHKTVLANFYNNGTEPCKARMVRTISYYRYCASKALSARCLVVPSVGRKWHMLLLLPTDRCGVHAVEYRLDAEALQQALKSCDETLVELSMPNIELESSVSLRQVLRRAGLAALFDPEKADLSGLLKESGEPLTEFVHKVKLSVNKVGHEGEHHGVTVINESGEHPVSPVEFYVNHPFVFVIYEPVSNTTMFVGRVVELIW